MVMDPVHISVDHGRHQSTVDHEQGLGGGSPEDGRNGTPMRGTSTQLRKNGEGTAVILTGCKRGQRRDGNGQASVGNNQRRRRSMRAALGRGEKRDGERSGEARGWCLPFIGAGEGYAGVRKGETARGNGLNAIEGGAT
jgi:hypothetical protein